MMGKSVTFARDDLPPAARAEVLWAWHALSAATRCESVVAFWDGMCIAHHGLACDDCQPSSSSPEGPICKGVMQQGKANYLANLILFPGALPRIDVHDSFAAELKCAAACVYLAHITQEAPSQVLCAMLAPPHSSMWCRVHPLLLCRADRILQLLAC